MITTNEAQTLLRGNVVGTDGDKIGSVGQIFLDDTTGEPAWVTVKTGLFGTGESFVPLDQAEARGEDIAVPYAKDKVKDAPRVDDAEGHLDPTEERELYAYYGLGYDQTDTVDTTRTSDVDTTNVDTTDGDTAGLGAVGTGAGAGTTTDVDRSAGRDTSGPNTDDAMTRSEEQLRVGTTTETTGRARLRKYIVTENVTKTVPVSHEEVRIEREPITDANVGDALSGGDLTEEEHEVTLSAERVVVDKDVVPVERVKLGTETVTEDAVVDEQVRHEEIETDTDGTDVDTDGTTDTATRTAGDATQRDDRV